MQNPSNNQPLHNQYAPNVQSQQNQMSYPPQGQFHANVDQTQFVEPEGVFKFDSASVRNNFIKKVYLILATQLIITAGMCAIPFNSEEAHQWYMKNAWLVALCGLVTIICSYALFCYKSIARSVPTNYILLSIFTLAMAFTVSFSCAVAPPDLVLIALFLTAFLVVGLTVYAWTTTTDLTICGGMFFMLSFVLIGAMIIGLIIRSRIFEILMASVVILFYGLYLVYDTQLIVGGRTNELQVDDYIIGALMLYIDIVRIFLEILRLLQALNRNN